MSVWRLVGVFAASLFVASFAAAAAQTAGARGAPVWDTLERFDSDAEFLRYMRDVRRAARVRGVRWSRANVQYAQNEASPLCPDGTPPPCADAADERVTVTGSRIPAPARSAPQQMTPGITNVQTMGVDEGDIVKQIGQFLIVLQDGRLFVIDTRPDGRAGLRLTSRVNVYANPSSDMWYDEMLVTPERVLVTGYSYDQGASVLSVFTFSRDGVLAREAVYYISSNDYYDIENYATRLVNGKLVIYTPLDLTQVDPDRPMQWPLVRRWLREGQMTPGRRLFGAQDIYRPIAPTLQPSVHSVSVCDLGSPRPGDELNCETRGFVGGAYRTFLVSPTDAYLWVTPTWDERDEYMRSCETEPGVDALGVPAVVFRSPLSSRAPSAVFARGEPMDQFGLAASTHEFRALLTWNGDSCARDESGADVRYMHIPLAAFTASPRRASAAAYQRLPSPGSTTYESRFTDDYVVYGGHDGQYYPPEDSESPRVSRVVAVPLAQPSQAVVLDAPHESRRVERVGNNIIVTGYGDAAGLSVSLVDLSGRPRIADTHVLEGRFESEGRSHAFNSFVGEDGAGLMGVPTRARRDRAGRWWWDSAASDVSFLSVDPAGRLASLGPLTADEHARHGAYKCQVSCVDWYGNTRPIFTDGRVFALSGVELIEGVVDGGAIAERRRLNLSAPPPQS